MFKFINATYSFQELILFARIEVCAYNHIEPGAILGVSVLKYYLLCLPSIHSRAISYINTIVHTKLQKQEFPLGFKKNIVTIHPLTKI